MQVDPIKPMLRSPGTQRLKLTFENLLLSFAFKFKLRRYITVFGHAVFLNAVAMQLVTACEAGAYTRPLFSST